MSVCVRVCPCVCVCVCRERATAEECLQHPWLHQPSEALKEDADPLEKPVGECLLVPASPGSTGSSYSAESDPDADPEEVTEELIVMAAYTLGQCRQTSDKETLTPDQKAISKRFKFEEPFSALQEVPGEFIY